MNDDKLDKLLAALHTLDKKVDRIEVSLKYAKAKQVADESERQKEHNDIKIQLVPIQKHVDVVTTVMKIGAWLIGSGSLTTLLYFLARR